MEFSRLHSLSINKRLGLVTLSAILGISILTAVFMFSERKLIMEERQNNIRQTVETAHGILEHYHKLATTGDMSQEEAKRGAVGAIKALRYSGNEYFWLNDMRPTMVMHPFKPELDGKDLTESKDPTGKRLFVDMVNTVKANGSGYVEYMWPKPGSSQPVPKVSYVKGFAPWGWIIGSGVYVDTVETTFMVRLIKFSIGAGLLGLALLAICLAISRSLIQQLGGEPDYAASIASGIAEGNLTAAIKLKKGDKTSLLYAMKTMRDSIAEIVGQVRAGTDTIVTASTHIATGNADLSARTEQQASSLEETASTMEEITSTVKQNADNARQANQLAVSASDVAVKGGAVVTQVVDTMASINESSKKIVDIISVIDGIAFQTNILALNAAVEAARAGEQGRGFAVVASEVRSLAQRSATAAKEIKELIGDSVDKVALGSKLVNDAGVTMHELVSRVRRVTDIMGEIMSASEEQSGGIEQINQSITQMDQATQQNAALVEQAAAASEAMQGEAARLAEVVGVFRVNGTSTAIRNTSAVVGQQTSEVPQPRGLPLNTSSVKRLTTASGDDWKQF